MIALILAMALAAFQDGASAPTGPKPINPVSWISGDDYPRSAYARREQSVILFTLDVNPKGKVTGCTVTKSSGLASLDRHTCEIMQRRGRFRSATDAAGKAIPSIWNSTFTWRGRR